MTRPSKGAAAFLTIFGLMFLVPALYFLFTVVLGSQQQSGRLAAGAIALLFIFVGGGFIYAAFGGYRRLKQQEALEEANPGSPWLWRADWASRRAISQHKNQEIGAWILCILGNLFLLPFAISFLPMLAHYGDLRSLPVLGFCCLGPLLLIYAVRASLRHHRFGNTSFELDALPYIPGGRLSGRIHLKFDTDAQHGIDLRLSCLRKTVTNTGNNRTTVQTVLWQSDKNVPSSAISSDPFERTIPVDFAIPADAYVTDHDNPSDQVLWQIHAQADIPGIDYSDDFEVPVFKTSLAPQGMSEQGFSTGFGPASDAGASADSSSVAPPANPKVVISATDGGTEFYFPAFRSPARALLLLFFTVVWSAIVVFLFNSKAPWFFPVVFGFFDLFLVLGVFHSVLGTSRIRVGNGELVSSSRVLGIGGSRRFTASDIDSILPVTSGQQGGSPSNTTYAIRLRTKAGRRFTLADEITSRQEARWIVSQIESLAGLKVDTRVEVTAPFGAPPQPPQPGVGSVQSGIGTANWRQARQPARAGNLIAASLFFLFIGGMIAFQAWRFSNIKAVAGARNSRAATASRMPGRRVFATPMTDSDVARVLALPAQDQAEELFERAIEHDDHARELFKQHIQEWIGHIRLTERMKELERRSEFSSDLRVRYENADMNLALDGWQENEQAADMLIARAQSDQGYRAAAVYFLGMLAGRGVAYEKIYPVLLNYAKRDPDPIVRQWAVEGMRYLGKPEALDELFDSFTHDPSMNVRDRAGCNISDCGNFTRAQRMRMVPKFLELVLDSKTDPQTRSWSFLALHEITDENLPANAEAWRDWYGRDGAGKLAEFEQQPWWQVHGDE
ncbi:MAG TPA: HEAT repeat domain-containing protein [Candidatus Acidoferrum sp.]|nr:HEAT repeat domain-containing protein [Candidatus Acidoferrum sp.]